MDLARIFFRHFQCFLSVPRFEHLVSQPRKYLGSHATHALFILGKEYRLIAARHLFSLFGMADAVACLPRPRQVDSYARPLPQFAFYPNVPPALTNNSI